jgi:hypothetical protein
MKKRVYKLENSSGMGTLVTDNLQSIKDWIETDVDNTSMEDLKEEIYYISFDEMTQEEIDNLPEWQG